jgi:hypothetical protein
MANICKYWSERLTLQNTVPGLSVQLFFGSLVSWLNIIHRHGLIADPNDGAGMVSEELVNI